MKQDNDREQLAELTRVTETFGADARRWPEAVRGRMEDLVARSAEARSIVAEARALDEVIAHGQEAAAGTRVSLDRLTDRIMAAATSDASVRKAADIVAFPVQRPAARPPVKSRSLMPWQAGGLVAASLVAGLLLGNSLNMAPVVQEIVEVAGLSTIDPAIGDDIGEDEAL